MQGLPFTFRSDGFDFRQLDRIGDVVLLEKTAEWSTRQFYEVVIVQHHKPRPPWCNGGERMPSSEQWGVAGWSYSDLPGARTKFNALVEADQSRTQTKRA